MKQMNARFQGYLPIVVDVETGGVNPKTDALLELAATVIHFDPKTEQFTSGEEWHHHIEVFEGGKLDPEALAVNHIDPFHPFRMAQPEKQALPDFFIWAQNHVKKAGCRRAVLVGHNAHFDLSFLQAAAKRTGLQNKNPFHRFTCFDTATLGGLMYGKTVLARALAAAGISFDKSAAHSALYDTQKTAEFFCKILNQIPFPGAALAAPLETDTEDEER